MEHIDLLELAQRVTIEARKLQNIRLGYVGCALISENQIYTGINLDFDCGLGFCAEHSAISNMVKSGKTKISLIVAITHDGKILPPCGRCRELIFQINNENLETEIILEEKVVKLKELLPYNWQDYI